jgi:hypothetical protein
MLDIDVKNGQNLARHSQIFLPIAIVRQAARLKSKLRKQRSSRVFSIAVRVSLFQKRKES